MSQLLAKFKKVRIYLDKFLDSILETKMSWIYVHSVRHLKCLMLNHWNVCKKKTAEFTFNRWWVPTSFRQMRWDGQYLCRDSPHAANLSLQRPADSLAISNYLVNIIMYFLIIEIICTLFNLHKIVYKTICPL